MLYSILVNYKKGFTAMAIEDLWGTKYLVTVTYEYFLQVSDSIMRGWKNIEWDCIVPHVSRRELADMREHVVKELTDSGKHVLQGTITFTNFQRMSTR